MPAGRGSEMCVAEIVAVGLALVGATSPGLAYCSQPFAPSCATRYGAFDDQDDFDQCKRKMATYQSEAQEFLSCLQKEGDRVREDYNNAVASFNRRARG
jgi:hypothetical protein